jgi:hypothetical protein
MPAISHPKKKVSKLPETISRLIPKLKSRK